MCAAVTGMSEQSSSVSFSAILTLSILSAIYFIENYDRSLISVSPIPYIDYSSYEYSLLSGTLFALVYTLSGLFFSITNIFNQYRVYSIAFASFIFSLVIFLVPFAKTFYQQALIRIVMGLAQSVITPFSSGIISSHFHEKYRGIAFSIFNFGAYLSFALALSLGTFIYDTFGWKTGYYLFGLFGIFLSILTTFLAKENPYADEMEPLRSLSIPEPIANAIPSSSDRKGLSNSADSSPSSNTIGASCSSTLQEMIDLFGRVLSLWRSNPSLYLLCLATGVRIGAGYVWTAYTSVFFSELYLTNPDDDNDKCLYSYNRTYTSPSLPTTEHFYSSSTVCDADYPYCFPSSGECREINSLPWHNEGISHLKLESFMSWIPLVGSGLGSMLGGHLSDILSRHSNRGTSANSWSFGRAGRPLVAGASALISTPFIVLALLAGYPGCFLYFIPSGFTGEMYIGASLALLSDVTPSDLIVPSVALFMFIITLIGGNCPLLVPLILSLRPTTHHTFSFQAAPPLGSPFSLSSTIPFHVDRRSGVDLQIALVIIFSFLYLFGGLLYFLCAYSLWTSPTSGSARYQPLPLSPEEQQQQQKGSLER